MITTELTNEQYHDHDSISKSGLDLVARSPAHYRYAEQREPTRAMVIGSAVHAAILEPEVFASQYMLLRDVKDRRASEYKQAVSVHGADFVLTGTEADYVSGIQESVQQHTKLRSLLAADGRAELSVITKDPITGVAVRCRFDWLTHAGVPVDLKTTLDARPDAFSRSVSNYRYHVQAAFYCDVWELETGEKLDRMVFAALEKAMPHAVQLYMLDDEAMAVGRKLYREALNVYADCLESGHWPAYGEDVQLLNLPPWAVEYEDEEQDDE